MQAAQTNYRFIIVNMSSSKVNRISEEVRGSEKRERMINKARVRERTRK